MTTLAERVLVVIYGLCGGEPGVPVHRLAIAEECNRVGIKTMTDVAFELYRARVISEVEQRRLFSGWVKPAHQQAKGQS